MNSLNDKDNYFTNEEIKIIQKYVNNLELIKDKDTNEVISLSSYFKNGFMYEIRKISNKFLATVVTIDVNTKNLNICHRSFNKLSSLIFDFRTSIDERIIDIDTHIRKINYKLKKAKLMFYVNLAALVILMAYFIKISIN